MDAGRRVSGVWSRQSVAPLTSTKIGKPVALITGGDRPHAQPAGAASLASSSTVSASWEAKAP